MKRALSYGAEFTALVVLSWSGMSQNVIPVSDEVTASDAAPVRLFGEALDLSADLVVAGGVGAYVFRETPGGYVEEAQLTAPFTTSSFGNAVAAEGDRVVIGEKGDSELGLDARAFVFHFDGSVWSQEAVLPPFGVPPFFDYGCAVDITQDLCCVGAPEEGLFVATGLAYIFTLVGTTWPFEAQLAAGDGALLDRFGSALSLDQSLCIVGAPGDQDVGTDTGSAYIFERVGTNWGEQQKLVAFDQAAGDLYGSSVSVSGNTVAIAAPGDSDSGTSSGSVYIYTGASGNWSLEAKIVASDASSGDEFGSSLSLDGDRLLVGARGQNSGGVAAGAAYFYEREGGSWVERAKFVSGSPGADDMFGVSVALEGERSAVGASRDDDAGTDSGSVYAFSPLRCAREDDAFEPNDLCGASSVLGAGTASDLVVFDDDPDFFAITVPAMTTLDLSATFADALGDIDLRLWTVGCGGLLDSSLSSTDNESVSTTNNTASPVSFVAQVDVAEACNSYSLEVVLTFNGGPGNCPADDANTTNQDCANAAPLGLGVSGPFSVQGIASPLGVNEDWWIFTVPPMEEITIDVLFTHVAGSGDIDLDLYDDAGVCGNEVDSAGSTTDNEQVTYANATAAPVTVTLRVFNFSATLADCADYSINAVSAPLPPDLCGMGVDDAEEDNDSCLTATVLSANPLSTLVVTITDEDFYSYTLNPGEIIDIRLDYENDDGDVDAQLIDASDCATVLVDSNLSFSDFEDLTYSNGTGAVQTIVLRVYLDASDTCNTYDLSSTISLDPCFTAPDDAEEDNDTCLTAVVPSANPLAGLFASIADEDFYTYTVNNGEILTVDLTFLDVNGDIDLQLLDGSDCTTVLDSSTSGTDDEQAVFNNSTGAAVTVIARVSVFGSSVPRCNNYDLASAIMPDPCAGAMDDSFEENDDCLTAAPVATGTQTGLFVRKEGVDEDWFSIDVTDSATITVTCTFVNDDGDIDIDLFDACAGTLLDNAVSTLDIEDVTWTNTTGVTVNVKWAVFVWSGDPDFDCNTYDMDVDVQGGVQTNLVPYCFGDGSGTPCPCGNNSTAGHPGGCANSAGNGATLVATGNPSVAADTLNLDLSSASQNSFALLVSGVNQLPQMGACIGCGILAFDGLRCAGGQFLRHGSRATNAVGETGNGWGPPGGPPGGLVAFNGFTAGSTRNFFAFYRDDETQVCQTGQNSSNGIAVTFEP